MSVATQPHELVDHAHRCLLRAATLLGRWEGGGLALDLEQTLELFRHRLVEELSRPSGYLDVDELIDTLSDLDDTLDAFARNRRRTSSAVDADAVMDAVAQLSDLAPEQMLARVAEVVAEHFAFTRVMTSSVQNAIMRPIGLHIDRELLARSKGVIDYIARARVPLAASRPERDAVRKQVCLRVRSPMTAAGNFKEMARISQSSEYIVAPILLRGRTIGLLHGDRYGSYGLEEADRLSMLAFSSLFAVAYERARLRAAALDHHNQLERALRRVEDVLSGDRTAAVPDTDEAQRGRAAPTIPDAPRPSDPRTGSRPSASRALTRREADVVRLASLGLSNAEIAARLQLSPSTVNSHVASALKALGVRSRASAVALLLRDRRA